MHAKSRYTNFSNIMPETGEKKRKKITAKLEASVTHGAPSSTHDAYASKRCPNIKHDAQGITYDAQRIKCNAQASRRCPSIKDDLCRKVNDPSHDPVTSHHSKQHTQTHIMSSTCKTNRDKTECQVPKHYRAQALKRECKNRTQVLNGCRKFTALSLPHGVEEAFHLCKNFLRISARARHFIPYHAVQVGG